MVSAVQALRLLSRQDSTPAHHQAFVEQLWPDTNHRTACIIIAANVETALDAALESVLLLDNRSETSEGDGILGTFARKIELGYALRIYGPRTRANLTTLRHLRNAFAHAKIPLTFDTPQVAAVCDMFEILPVLPPSNSTAKTSKDGLGPRQLFEEVTNVLAHNFMFWSLEPVQEIHENALKPEIDHDPAWTLFRRRPPLP
jgi:hypothetical protein